MSHHVVTGLSLKMKRVEQRVRVIDLAAAMRVTHARVSQIENQATVTPDAVRKYLEALATFAHVPETDEAVA